MSDISEPKRCPKCGAAIPDEAPQGLCPKCVLAQASIPTEGTKSQPAPTREEIARAFPQLEILELIGQGGMGFVFKARQPKLERLVALKILPQALAADPAFAERFSREARLLARLNHPNIVHIHDFGHAGGYFYLLMEYVDGVNLRQAMRAGRFTPAQALVVVPKICEALQFAHDEGILHRDIKPENILVDVRGRVKIADFGIAKLVGDAQPEGTLTGSGATLGTPHYMAPEQLEKPGTVDHRADIYSLGVVFYEMLTGELPLGRFQPPSQKVEVDVRLDQVVLHALEKDPSRRYQHASQVRTAVETISSGPAPASVAAGPDRFWRRMAVAMSLLCLTLIVLIAGFAKSFLNARNTVASQPTASIPANRTDKESQPLVLVTVPTPPSHVRMDAPLQYHDVIRWEFKYLIPADHLAQVVFVVWSNGVPIVKPGFSGYFKVGPKAVNIDSMSINYTPHPFDDPQPSFPTGVTNVVQWVVSPGFGYTAGTFFTNQPPCHRLDTAPRSVLRSGDQLAIRLAEFDQPAGVASNGWSGVEMRWMLQPLSSPAVQTDPNEFDRTNYVAGFGLAEAFEDSIMKMIKDLSIEPQAASVPANKTDKESQPLVLVTVPTPPSHVRMDAPLQYHDVIRWEFKYLIPADHLAQVVFVKWSNGVPAIEPGFSGYFKVGPKPVNIDSMSITYVPHEGSNVVDWAVNPGFGYTAGALFTNQPPLRKLETAPRSVLRSGDQLAIRLAEFIEPAGAASNGWSGMEIRLILQPLSSPAVLTDPNEVVGTDYVAGWGLAGASEDSIMTMIKDLPIEPQAASVPASETEKDTAELVIDTSKKTFGGVDPDPRAFWPFTCLVPAGHLAQFVFVLRSNGVATIRPDFSGYIKAGEKPVVFENILFGGNTNTTRALDTNVLQWFACYTDFNHNAIGLISNQAPIRKLETPPRSVLHSGYQLAFRLAESIPPANSGREKWSGVEIRLILQALSSPAVQTDPNEVVGTDYVAGFGLAGASKDSIMKMVNDLPVEPQAADKSP